MSHTVFSLAFSAFVYIGCNIQNVDNVASWFLVAGQIDTVGLLSFYAIGFCLFLIFLLLLTHPFIVKPISILLIILSASASYFIVKYNVAIDNSMVQNAINTDSRELKGLLSYQMLPFTVFLILLPICILSRTIISFSRYGKYLIESLVLIIAATVFAIGLIYVNFDSLHRAGNLSKKHILHTLVPVNYIRSSISLAADYIEPRFSAQQKPPELLASVEKETDLIVVLAIGETARQKNMGLYGYKRANTNPILENMAGLHALNGIARVGSTLYALREILEKKDVKLPAITSHVGIDTACYVNFSLNDNCDAVGEVAVSDCKHPEGCFDEDVIPMLEQKLNTYKNGSRFIVLHLGGGSHGPRYNDRHPPHFQILQPTCNDADVVNQCTVEELYNSYDNTLLYLDFVLAEIIERLEASKAPYVFIYLSDHGESLLENGRIFHGMPPAIPLPPEQAQIPLLVKASVPIKIKQRNNYLQPDVFDSILSLFSIQTNTLNEERSFILRQ